MGYVTWFLSGIRRYGEWISERPPPNWAFQMLDQQALTLQKMETIMGALDELKAAMSDLVTEAITDLEAVIAKLNDLASKTVVDPADLAALTQQATDTTAKLKADIAGLTPPTT